MFRVSSRLGGRTYSGDIMSYNPSIYQFWGVIICWILSRSRYTLGLWLGPGWSQFGSHTRLQTSNIFNTTKAPLALATLRFYAGSDLQLLGACFLFISVGFNRKLRTCVFFFGIL